MEQQFFIQDPRNPDTTYLYESIIESVMTGSLQRWRGIYAFASGAGVRSLFVDDADITGFLRRGDTELVVGIDAVTNLNALNELAALNEKYPRFKARVFIDEDSLLFHPKVSHFQYENDVAKIIIGSGNLTHGGLEKNIEAFSIITGTSAEIGTLRSWDGFLEFHREHIRDIDNEARELARENQRRMRARVRRKREDHQIEEGEPIIEDDVQPTAKIDESAPLDDNVDRVLVAQVPRAGNRWRQVHYNEAVVNEFFRMRHNSPQRAHLQEVRPDGVVSAIEIRPLVYSESNRNYKIEISARPELQYPSNTPPIIVLREIATRMFRYTLLLPGDDGYAAMLAFTNDNPSVGKGFRRVISDIATIKQVWPSVPL